jgi:hypothetical protein
MPRNALHLHPLVYIAMVALVIWLVVAVWGFAGAGYAGLAVVIVSLFLFVALALPAVLWRISRRGRDAGLDAGEHERFGDWLDGELETWQGPLKGAQAATQIILPLAAAAIGMTALALVLHFTAAA